MKMITIIKEIFFLHFGYFTNELGRQVFRSVHKISKCNTYNKMLLSGSINSIQPMHLKITCFNTNVDGFLSI